MPAFEVRNLGNFLEGQLEMPTKETIVNGRRLTTPSLAQGWRDQGISFVTAAPFETSRMSLAELEALGYVGVTLMIPKPDKPEAPQDL